MEVRLHDSADEFRAIAEPLYRRDPVVHTIELTLLEANRFPDDTLLLTVSGDGVSVGAALQTPPYPLASNAIPVDAMDAVATQLVEWRPGLTGVRGTSRLATDDDRGLMVEWVGLFFDEAFSQVHNDGGEEFVDTANRVGRRFVLWDIDGTPASMAMLRVPAFGVSRIGPVFTPRDRRGHGYGSAVTAAAAQLARCSGTADVVLFADLANPTSNAIYQRIGFEAVVDSVRIDFVTVG